MISEGYYDEESDAIVLHFHAEKGNTKGIAKWEGGDIITENFWKYAKTETVNGIENMLRKYGFSNEVIESIKKRIESVGILYRIKKAVISIAMWQDMNVYASPDITFDAYYRGISGDLERGNFSEVGWVKFKQVHVCVKACKEMERPCHPELPVPFTHDSTTTKTYTFTWEPDNVITNKLKFHAEDISFIQHSHIHYLDVVVWAKPVGWEALTPGFNVLIHIPLLDRAESLVLNTGESATFDVNVKRLSGAGKVTLYVNDKSQGTQTMGDEATWTVKYTAPSDIDGEVVHINIPLKFKLEDSRDGSESWREKNVPVVVKKPIRKPIIRFGKREWIKGPIVYEGNYNDNLTATNDCSTIKVEVKNVTDVPGYYSIYNLNLNQLVEGGYLKANESKVIEIKNYATYWDNDIKQQHDFIVKYVLYSSPEKNPYYTGYRTDTLVVRTIVLRPRFNVIRRIINDLGEEKPRVRLGKRFKLRYDLQLGASGGKDASFFNRTYPVSISLDNKIHHIGVASHTVEKEFEMPIAEVFEIGNITVNRYNVDVYGVGRHKISILEDMPKVMARHAIFIDSNLRGQAQLFKVRLYDLSVRIYPDEEEVNITAKVNARAVSSHMWDKVEELGKGKIPGTLMEEKVYNVVSKVRDVFQGTIMQCRLAVFELDKPLDLVYNGKLIKRDVKRFRFALGKVTALP